MKAANSLQLTRSDPMTTKRYRLFQAINENTHGSIDGWDIQAIEWDFNRSWIGVKKEEDSTPLFLSLIHI